MLSTVVTLSTTSSMHLGLENKPSSRIQLLGDGFSLLGSSGNVALLHQHAILSHDVLALVFVEVEISPDGASESTAVSREDAPGEHKICFIDYRRFIAERGWKS
jgi:hypothetical protein